MILKSVSAGQKSQAFVLAMILNFMVILFLLGGALAALTFPEFFFINRFSGMEAALHLADAGITEAVYRIKNGNYSNFSNSMNPALPAGSSILGNYNVTVSPDAGNSSDSLNMFHVTSTATIYTRPNISRCIKAIIEDTTFAEYLYFTDSEQMRGGGQRIWFKTGDELDGKVHSNDQISIYWGDYASYPPIFSSRVTTSSSATPPLYFDPRTPANQNEYKEIFTNGTAGFETGINRVAFPPSVSGQKVAALGGIAEPSNPGVYLPNSGGSPTGGIFVKGDIKQMRFSIDAANNQVITVTQKVTSQNRTTTIVLNPDANTTTYTSYTGTSTTYAGQPKGIFFATGSIEDLAGTVNTRMTVFTDPSEPNNAISITDNLQYQYDPRTNPGFNGALGLVAPDVTLPSSAPANIVINAAIMTPDSTGRHGSFYVEHWSSDPPKGYIHLLGGLMQNWRGPVGTFNTRTGALESGYLKDYHYDARFLHRPPPYFPTTGVFKVRFWKVLY